MSRPRILPSDRELERLVKDEGMTHQEIADLVFKQTGHKVARSTVSVAVTRAGLNERSHARFIEEIPWTLKAKDLRAYPIRMLRLLGNRRAGNHLTDDETKRLDSWLARMEMENAVVAWDPDVSPSVFYIDGDPADWPNGIPIRKERIYLNPPKK